MFSLMFTRSQKGSCVLGLNLSKNKSTNKSPLREEYIYKGLKLYFFDFILLQTI
uniref:Uncharacterized protein n=1 Tax=Ciona intestinalis TaxID=7719 RepID=H2XJK1_CIOIN